MPCKKVAKPRDVYSLIAEETKKIVDTSVTTHFHPPPPPLKPVVPEDAMKFFMNMAKSRQTWEASSKLLSDYECISKKQAKRKSGPIVEDAPSIGGFLADSRLTAEQLAQLVAGGEIRKLDVTWPFELDKPLVKPDIENKLTPQMRRLHIWYLE